MATWTQAEINTVLQYVQSKNGPITSEDHKELQRQLKTRSVAGIKKKCLELKQNVHNQQNDNPGTSKQGNIWTKTEERRLIREYMNRTEAQVTKRTKAILNLFPGGTEKAIATKLREKYPEIYYMRKVQLTDSESEEETAQGTNLNEITNSERQVENSTEINQESEQIQMQTHSFQPTIVTDNSLDGVPREDRLQPLSQESIKELENIRAEPYKDSRKCGEKQRTNTKSIHENSTPQVCTVSK